MRGRNGWLIEGQSQGGDLDAVDAADAEALYQLLEREVVPTFYDRDAQGIPRALVRHRPAGHPDRHPEILGATHGQAVRRRDVRAGHPGGRGTRPAIMR